MRSMVEGVAVRCPTCRIGRSGEVRVSANERGHRCETPTTGLRPVPVPHFVEGGEAHHRLRPPRWGRKAAILRTTHVTRYSARVRA